MAHALTTQVLPLAFCQGYSTDFTIMVDMGQNFLQTDNPIVRKANHKGRFTRKVTLSATALLSGFTPFYAFS